MINPKIFKAYDIRGIYPDDINENNYPAIVSSIYQLFQNKLRKKNLKIGIGRDMRLSSPILHQSAINRLVALGADVYDFGLVSTPTIYYAILYKKLDGGIQVSASHNPKQWNGAKFFYLNNQTIVKIGQGNGMETVAQTVNHQLSNQLSSRGHLHRVKNFVKKEVDFAFKITQLKKITPLTIAVDPANGMAITYLTELFTRLPVNLIKLNYTLDGSFPAHEANPLKFETLKELQQTIINKHADFGVAPDGDGDRIFFIDEKGKIVSASIITALIAHQLLTLNPKAKIIVDIRYIRNVQAVCSRLKAKLLFSRVGHALITRQLNQTKADFAGESSGHYYFKETGGAESSVRVILEVIKAINKYNMPLSQIVRLYQSTNESGELNFILPKNKQLKDITQPLIKHYSDGKINLLDGLSIDFRNWRFNIRGSNTEPLIRLNLEADQLNFRRQQLAQLKSIIINLGCQPK